MMVDEIMYFRMEFNQLWVSFDPVNDVFVSVHIKVLSVAFVFGTLNIFNN